MWFIPDAHNSSCLSKFSYYEEVLISAERMKEVESFGAITAIVWWKFKIDVRSCKYLL